MRLTILKRLFARRNSRIVLLVELLLSYLAFFLIISFMVKQMQNNRYPLGFDYKNIYKIGIDASTVTDQATVEQEVDAIMDFVIEYPGVQSMSWCFSSFFFQKGYMNTYRPLRYGDLAIPADQVNQMVVDDDFSRTMGIEVTEGRWFEPGDNAAANRPVVVSELLRTKLFGTGRAVGEIVDYCGQQCRVVGVCKNFKHKGDYTRPEATIILRNGDPDEVEYETGTCMSGSSCGYNEFVKTTGSLPETFEPDLIAQVAQRFNGIVLTIQSMDRTHTQYVTNTWLPLVAIFLVILALFLNVLFGMFGVMWYNISLRRSEIGLRMAVGANKGHIYRQFVGEMVVLTTVAVIPGLILAAQAPILDLFEMGTRVYIISMILAAVVIYILVTTCVLLPSARATKILPAVALHEE